MKYVEKFREKDRALIVQLAKKSLKTDEGKEALAYLKNERNFSDEAIDKFNIGYCPLSIDHQLRGRIITPLYDAHDNLIVLTTRHLDEKHSSRFWHESFDKGSFLYGLNCAKYYILKYKKAILVEGEFDVIALHSEGFKMTIGVCGSALTFFQSALLFRYCSEVYIMFDGDTSGKRSIERIMKMYDKYDLDGYKVKYIPVYLPDNKDPNDCIKEGKEKMKNYLIQAKKNYSLFG